MRIVWTKHAQDRQKEWERKLAITRQEVEDILSNPEQIVPGDQNVLVAQSKRGNGLLRVPFIDINFEFLEKANGKWKTIAKENHKMRFWYLKELEYFLSKNGFRLVKACHPLNLDLPVSEDNWDIFVIAQKN